MIRTALFTFLIWMMAVVAQKGFDSPELHWSITVCVGGLMYVLSMALIEWIQVHWYIKGQAENDKKNPNKSGQ